MIYALLVFIVIVAILLIVVVMVQNSKGGGIIGSMSSANQLVGARRTTDFLEKATWSLIGILVVSCLLVNSMYDTGASASPEVRSSAAERAKERLQTNTAIPGLNEVQEEGNELILETEEGAE